SIVAGRRPGVVAGRHEPVARPGDSELRAASRRRGAARHLRRHRPARARARVRDADRRHARRGLGPARRQRPATARRRRVRPARGRGPGAVREARDVALTMNANHGGPSAMRTRLPAVAFGFTLLAVLAVPALADWPTFGRAIDAAPGDHLGP